jgi:iron complex transport system ATP-binding protein
MDGLLAESGLTLVAAMHDLTLAAQYADRMVLLDGGRVVADGPPADVLEPTRLARHYDADASGIVDVAGQIAVVPQRPATLVTLTAPTSAGARTACSPAWC